MAETLVPIELPRLTKAVVAPTAGAPPVFHNRHPMHHDSSAAGRALAEMDGIRRAEGAQRDQHRSELYASGRLLLSVFFIGAAVDRLFDLGALERLVNSTVAADAGFLVPLAIAVELIGGAMLAVGYQGRVVAAGLLAYLGARTLLMHFDLTIPANRAAALVNLALGCGLLLILGQGSGGLSVDRYLERRRLSRERL